MNRLFVRGLYNLALTSGWPPAWFYYQLRIRGDGKYRSSYRQRLGLSLPPSSGEAQTIWVHALSLGETLSVLPLLAALRAGFPDHEIVLSSATESGHALACTRAAHLSDRRFILPHDFVWSMNQVVSRIRPSLFVLTETDLWPNLIEILQRRQIPAVLVNGRISERSFRRLKPFRQITGALLHGFSLIFTQSKRDQIHFQKLGADPETLFAVGNLKFDLVRHAARTTQTDSLRSALRLQADRPVWLAGSTHPGEEEPLLIAHQRLRQRFPNLLLLLAPRQPQRRGQIADLCRGLGFQVGLRSGAETTDAKDVYLLDTLGELGHCYPLARVAFIGGSLIPFGGHNPLEAAVFGVPTCWGPHLSNFREIEESLLNYGCSRTVHTISELVEQVAGWLADRNERAAVASNCSRLFAAHREVARHIVRLIRRSIPLSSARP